MEGILGTFYIMLSCSLFSYNYLTDIQLILINCRNELD